MVRGVLSSPLTQAEVTAAIAAAIAAEKTAQFPDIIEPVMLMRNAGTTTTAGLTANAVYLYRFRVSEPITIANAIILNGATVAGTLALGVYTSDGTTWTRVAATADTAHAGTNAQQVIPIAAPYTLIPGIDYWSAFGGTDATATILRIGLAGGLGGLKNNSLIKTAVYSSGLPATITTPVTATLLFYHAFTTA